MTVRAVADPAAEIRASVRIAKLAAAWDCDETQVRRLIDAGELEAHGIGRAVRVYIDSANDYQARNAKPPKATRTPVRRERRPPHRPVDNAAHKAAMATLRRQGIV